MCLHQLFEAQVARTPQAVALVFGAETISYEELNRRANQLGATCRDWGWGRKCEWECCWSGHGDGGQLLAVLKAGGAYVPLEPEYRGERLSFMVGDTEPGLRDEWGAGAGRELEYEWSAGDVAWSRGGWERRKERTGSRDGRRAWRT